MFTDANLKISSETFFCNSLNADGLCLNRSIAISTPDVNLSAENVISGINSETMVSICSQQFDSAKFCSLILLKFVQTNSGD